MALMESQPNAINSSRASHEIREGAVQLKEGRRAISKKYFFVLHRHLHLPTGIAVPESRRGGKTASASIRG
jgi:hypothetical protein